MITARLSLFGYEVAVLVLEGRDDIDLEFALLDELQADEETDK